MTSGHLGNYTSLTDVTQHLSLIRLGDSQQIRRPENRTMGHETAEKAKREMRPSRIRMAKRPA